MPIEVKLPALSPTMEQGTLARWLVHEGDAVRAGDLLAEIETDKATMEFEAVDDGVVLRIVVAEGTDDVPVGTVIALIGAEGEATGTPQPSATPPAAPAPALAVAPRVEPVAPIAVVPRQPRGEVDGTLLAHKLATLRGIDLATLRQDGGRVMATDVLPRAAADADPSPPPSAPTPAPGAAAIPAIPHTLHRLTSMRRTIARRLTESKQQVPHIYLSATVELDRLLDTRATLNATLAPRGIKVSINDLVIKALALALEQVPACNVQFAGDTLARFERADIAVAVSIPEGLVTPVIVDAGARSVSAIATEMRSLAARAREGALQPADYAGGTASLSNLGMFGIESFDPILNPPQAVILGVGCSRPMLAMRDGVPQQRSVMTITGGFDHRAIDGADAAALIGAVRQLLEDPLRLLA